MQTYPRAREGEDALREAIAAFDESGFARVVMDCSGKMNPHRVAHGEAIFSLADHAFGIAANCSGADRVAYRDCRACRGYRELFYLPGGSLGEYAAGRSFHRCCAQNTSRMRDQTKNIKARQRKMAVLSKKPSQSRHNRGIRSFYIALSPVKPAPLRTSAESPEAEFDPED
ncbi:MAG: hypothetical protein METHP_02044 [Methanoregula sp. SKADARSKE-2]|nr:MAG: hypothetical protein METHP_02044 [Methanoregula sp. SKADARSKE-2]